MGVTDYKTERNITSVVIEFPPKGKLLVTKLLAGIFERKAIFFREKPFKNLCLFLRDYETS